MNKEMQAIAEQLQRNRRMPSLSELVRTLVREDCERRGVDFESVSSSPVSTAPASAASLAGKAAAKKASGKKP